MRLATFIEGNAAPILGEWATFAKTRIPAAATMSALELRNLAKEILTDIVKDMRLAQSEDQRETKSKGLAPPSGGDKTAASAHGEMRHLSGFDLPQLTSEFRAMRAAILRLWAKQAVALDAVDIEDLTRMNESIDQALAESVAGYSAKIDESRDTFLAVLGHDLRGPLASISNCVHLQAGPSQSAALRERTVQIALRSVGSMAQMITDLLDYTRTRLGRGIEVRTSLGDIGELCQESFEQTRAAYPDSDFKFESSGQLSANFDAARMRQVLVNLLTNAAQHGDRSSPIHFSVQGDSSEITIVVNNAGTSIPADALQVIFNPLVQVPHAASAPHERPSTSLGLGLYIAREIVGAHCGAISVTSTAAGGTTFTVRLPRGSALG